VCVCSLSYLTCNAHASYCHLWPVRFYHIFPHNLINGTLLEKEVTQRKICVLIFSTKFSETLVILRIIQRDTIINLHLIFKYSIHYCRQILVKLRFSQQIFEKCPYVKFNENPSNGNRVVPCERTDRRDEANSHFYAILHCSKNPLPTIILHFQLSNK
jgi:hypothetical protein